MVRACSLPFRVLCRELGADVCYTDEIVDLKLAKCQTRETPSGVIEFFHEKDLSVTFAGCAADHPTVLQIGSASAESAVAAVHRVSHLVDGIDLNLGCTLHFSTQGGMGSALVSKPDAVREIVSALDRELSPSGKRVSCKMRLFETPEATADFVSSALVASGARTVAIHARRATETQRNPPRWAELSRVRELLSGSGVALIANGGVRKHEDIAAIRRATGIDDVMIGTAALENASIFAPAPIDSNQVVSRFLRHCVDFCNPAGTSKWVVLQVLLALPRSKKDQRLIEEVSKARSLRTLCETWNLEEYFDSKPHRLEGDGEGEAPAKKRNLST